MKVSKTENRFKTGFQQPKTGLPKTGFNIPTLRQLCVWSNFIFLALAYEVGWSLLSCDICNDILNDSKLITTMAKPIELFQVLYKYR